jgi:hypothetical protein
VSTMATGSEALKGLFNPTDAGLINNLRNFPTLQSLSLFIEALAIMPRTLCFPY